MPGGMVPAGKGAARLDGPQRQPGVQVGQAVAGMLARGGGPDVGWADPCGAPGAQDVAGYAED